MNTEETKEEVKCKNKCAGCTCVAGSACNTDNTEKEPTNE